MMKLNSLEHRTWLEKTTLVDIAKQYSMHFQRILKNCLRADGEKILIIGDKGYQSRRLSTLMSYGYYIGAKKLGLDAELVMQEPKLKGQKADPKVIESLQNLKSNSRPISSKA